MKVFQVPDEIDEFFTIQFIIIFLLGFMINVYANGNATLIFFHDYYGVDPGQDFIYADENLQYIEKYSSNTLHNNIYAFWISFFLYWFGIPLICIFFGIFKFNKPIWDNRRFEWKKEFFNFQKKISDADKISSFHAPGAPGPSDSLT